MFTALNTVHAHPDHEASGGIYKKISQVNLVLLVQGI
jgi:hypothetical protein